MAWRQSIEIPPVGHNAPIPMAARVGNMLFSSGIAGADPATGQLPEGVDDQAANAFKNLANVLAKAGAKPTDVGHVTVFLKDNAYRQAVNKPWVEMFPDEHSRPARHAIINPALNFALQLEVVAVIEGG